MKIYRLESVVLLWLLVTFGTSCGSIADGTNTSAEATNKPTSSPTNSLVHNGAGANLDAHITVDPDKNYVYAGFPVCSNSLTIISNSSYVVGYDEELKAPRWVAYRLFKIADVWQRVPAPSRKGISFEADKRTLARVTDADYEGIGKGIPGDTGAYDRGHMAPNASMADCYGTNGQDETFLLSNITIQKHTLNAETWAYLETEEEEGIANYYTNVWIIDGPVFEQNPKRFGKAAIAVPVAFFKILLVEIKGKPHVESVVMSQQVNGPLEQNQKVYATVTQVEKQTGLSFFHNLAAKQRSELETEDVLFSLPARDKSHSDDKHE